MKGKRSSRRRTSPADAARIRRASIDALRAAGVPPAAIGRAVGDRTPMRDLMTIQLSAIDLERARLARAAAAIRSALARDVDPATILRRLDVLGRASALERGERLGGVGREPVRSGSSRRPKASAYNGDAATAADDLRTSVFEAAFRELPDDMSDAQWDAFGELVGILEDARLVGDLRDESRGYWERAHGQHDLVSWRKLLDDLISQAHGAFVRDDPPTGRRGRVLSTRWVNHAASLQRVSMHDAAVDLLARAERQDRRVERVWELVAVVRGWDGPPPHISALRWLLEAVRAHLAFFKRS